MNILFVSLGCDKNSVDSEVMLGVLSKEGHTFTDDSLKADVCIINTCCFISDAKEESINTIIEFGELRKSGQLKALIATGCLAQRYAEDIRRELPEVDALVGIASIEKIGEALNNVLKGCPRDYFDSRSNPISGNHKRIVTTGGYYDYLKIAEGCDKRCTYCVIPYVRGPYRSVPMEDLLEEAKTLAINGVKELILVAQETTVYGVDLYKEKRLPRLLKELCRIEGLEIIRILYCYPEEITDELIEVMASEEKIANYLDIPIQSGSDKILKSMGRRTDVSGIYEAVRRLRERIPDICLRTTLITGFPTESEEDHAATLKMIEEVKFDRLGAFTYSKEEGTVASLMKGQVKSAVKKRRLNEIMSLQQTIAFEKTKKCVGKKYKTIIEGYLPEENVYVGRTYRDAPDVDGYLFINSERELLSGDIVEVVIKEAVEYDLIGDLVL